MARRFFPAPLGATMCVWLAGLALILLASCSAPLGPGGMPAVPIADPDAAARQGEEVTIAQNAQPGIGGTGKTPGIGGTGEVAQTPPGIGGTGIIGTVTGFGSILVNGYEVDYAPGLAIAFKDRTVRPDALRVGQVVAVEADGSGDRLRARRIAIRHEVAGPIERIDADTGIAFVFGQRVEVPAGTVADRNGARQLSLRDLAVGDHIDVSGLRRADGVIAASRVAKTGPNETVILRGRVSASDRTGFTVNGIRINSPLASRPADLAAGREVQIVGRAARGRLRARRIDLAPARPFAGRVRKLSVEGYMARRPSGVVAVGRVVVRKLPGRSRFEAGKRIILDGPIDARGRFAPSLLRSPRFRPPVTNPRRRVPDARPTPTRPRVRPPARPPVIRRQPPSRAPVHRAPPRPSRR